MGTLTLVLGGARSGKSEFAEGLVAAIGPSVLYVATAQAGDEEMADRIDRHQARRPATWRTLEAPRDVGRRLQQLGWCPDAILIDCLSLLVSNLSLALPDSLDTLAPEAVERFEKTVTAELDQIIQACRTTSAAMVVVSNEVGMGLVPPYPTGRAYRDVLGRANKRLAAEADRAYLIVAGLPLTMKG